MSRRGSGGFTIDCIVRSGITVNDGNIILFERSWYCQSDMSLCVLVSSIWSWCRNAKPESDVPLEEPVDISKLIVMFSDGGAVVATFEKFSPRKGMLVSPYTRINYVLVKDVVGYTSGSCLLVLVLHLAARCTFQN